MKWPLFISICENPTEIDTRVIATKHDWMYSNSILVHNANTESTPHWNIGPSKNGWDFSVEVKVFDVWNSTLVSYAQRNCKKRRAATILKFGFAVEITPHHQTQPKFHQLFRHQKTLLSMTQYQIRLIVLISVFQVQLDSNVNLESLMIVTKACPMKFYHFVVAAYWCFHQIQTGNVDQSATYPNNEVRKQHLSERDGLDMWGLLFEKNLNFRRFLKSWYSRIW